MQVLLDCIKEFCNWLGMELCVAKCEVTGYDFGTRTEIPMNTLTFGAASLTCLSPHMAFKYLGLWMSLTGSTRAEKQYVMTETQQISSKLDGHHLHTDQANTIVSMCAHQILTYSSPMTQWTFTELQSLELSWAVMHKQAWELTDQHNTAPFLLQ